MTRPADVQMLRELARRVAEGASLLIIPKVEGGC